MALRPHAPLGAPSHGGGVVWEEARDVERTTPKISHHAQPGVPGELCPVGLKLLVFEALQKLPEVFRSSQRDGSLYEDKDWFLDINVPSLFSTPIWHELEQVYNLLTGCGENVTLQFCQDQVRFRRCVQS